jgi:hypothetical protein
MNVCYLHSCSLIGREQFTEVIKNQNTTKHAECDKINLLKVIL